MDTILLGVGFGVVTGAILALSSVAFTLQYAVSSIPNLAHGELLTYGAYAAYVTQRYTHNLGAAALVAALTGGVVAWSMNAGMIEPFVRARVKRIAIFIATLGVSLILQNLILLIFGGANIAYTMPQTASHNIGPFIMTTRDEEIIVAAFVMMGVLYAMLQYTRFGKSLRAVAENRELARVSGIDAHRVVQFTWFLAGLVAGFAGFILAVSVGTLTPSFGFTFLLVTVTAAVAGGLGKPYGAMAAALVLGLAMEISAIYIDAAYKLAIAFGMLILVLLFRPDGLFTSKMAGTVE
ncbi:MAG TPA: branched-chain amino acid ABC transporter permease [bacterium]|nr:branched-chain amino acid ABC transporter permease [bacterium]